MDGDGQGVRYRHIEMGNPADGEVEEDNPNVELELEEHITPPTQGTNAVPLSSVVPAPPGPGSPQPGRSDAAPGVSHAGPRRPAPGPPDDLVGPLSPCRAKKQSNHYQAEMFFHERRAFLRR